MKLYRKQNGMWLERDDAHLRLEESFDLLVAREDLQGYLTSLASTATTAMDFDGSNSRHRSVIKRCGQRE